MRWGVVLVGVGAAAVGALVAWAGYEYQRAEADLEEMSGVWQVIDPDDDPPGRPKPPRSAPG